MTALRLGIQLDQAKDNNYDEQLFELALERPQALLWQGSKGLVVPRLYSQNPLFQDCAAHFAKLGWPLSTRQSGGGVVPQGPGVWNLSLAWRQYGKPLNLAEKAYQLLCTPVAQALTSCGVNSSTQAVEGSFCDGRFNLAVMHQNQAKKIVGTAQVWRRCQAPENTLSSTNQAGSQAGWHLVLAHALILIDTPNQIVTALANQVEEKLQRPPRYQPNRICNLVQLGISPESFAQHLTAHLRALILPHDDYTAEPPVTNQTNTAPPLFS